MLQLFIILNFLVFISAGYGPAVIATKGEVWPKPQQQTKLDNYFIIHPNNFSFQGPDSINCTNFLNSAFDRYWSIITSSASLERRGRLPEFGRKKFNKFWINDENNYGILDKLVVGINQDCNEDQIPDIQNDEKYNLEVDIDGARLEAETIWGVLRGLETFSQLIYLEQDTLVINATSITDYPRFSHRGLLLDTSRHFMPVYIILQTLDAMSYNKFNVFHWHITDDQSFPFKSLTYPELSEKGAYHSYSKVYEQYDVKKIIEYARIRGIRVVPEFDTPGHTSSWGASHPEILTTCYSNGEPNGNLGPMDPTKETTYLFLSNLFKEVIDLFPDSYFHIGGDEVDFSCWQSNPNITIFMKDNNITSYEQLESYFIQNVIEILNHLSSKYLVWEEVFTNGVTLSNSTVVHVWKGDGHDTLATVTEAGKIAVYSSCWYLDHLSSGGDWQKFYECEALDFNGTEAQKHLVLGGEACMWSEVVNEYNVQQRIWPRASATAEKLWSAEDVTNLSDAQQRLEEHACRMNYRGIPAQPPNGPGVCL